MLGAARGRSDGDGRCRCMHARMCAAVALVSARSARELDLARRTHGRFCDLLLGMCCSAPSPGCCPLLLRSRRALASCYYRPRSAGAFFSLPCLVQLDSIGLGSTGLQATTRSTGGTASTPSTYPHCGRTCGRRPRCKLQSSVGAGRRREASLREYASTCNRPTS
jgi:hypothetical protein